MRENRTIRYIDHDVEHCPRCGQRHQFKLTVQSGLPQAPAVPLFGGPGSHEIAFTCPITHELFTEQIINPPDGEIIGPANSTSIPAMSLPSKVESVTESEFSEWVKNSRTTATEFSKTMLTTSTGAIPVYFAVLNYIGIGKVGNSFLSRITILPPLLFLATIILFMLAIRPWFVTLTEADFDKFRAKRLSRLNVYITMGSVLFGIGVCLAIVLFFLAMRTT